MNSPYVRWSIVVLLAVLTLAVYAPARSFEFVLFDDDEYVYANPVVTRGLTAEGVKWAFGFHSGNWHPLTWLSHMADVQLFGMNAGAMHGTNVALHLLNVLLLAAVLVRLTGAFWRSLTVAALFAIHPLNVENVAWIAERKTLLSITFLLLTVLVWHAGVKKASWRLNAGAALLFACAVMAKPYAITLPVLLVLLDLWPLRRLEVAEVIRPDRWRVKLLPLVLEKLPFAVASSMSAILTFAAQRSEGAVAGLGAIGPLERVAGALVGLLWYVEKLFLPLRLSFYYPHPHSLGEAVSAPVALGGALLFVIVTVAAVRYARRLPYLLTGWLWFLAALLPVIGLVQVGYQAYADRYAYLPMIGLLVTIVWGLSELGTRVSARGAAVGIGIAAVAALSVAAAGQVRHWRDSEALFTHAIGVDDRNWAAWQNLGVHALQANDLSRAQFCFEKSLQSYRRNSMVLYNLGHVYSLRGDSYRAKGAYEETLAVNPNDAKALAALALTYRDLRDLSAALLTARRAVEADAGSAFGWYGLALVSGQAGLREESQNATARLRTMAPDLAREVEASLRFAPE